MPLHGDEDTIAAIATPPGAGGIGIIRISGSGARGIGERIFKPAASRPLVSHRLTYGHITDPDSGKTIDEVMLCLMRAPNSYTREDVVEIQAHAGHITLTTILALAIRFGARLAGPGEFTKRAFLNGRIDLTRAEAVLELMNARTPEGLDLAAGHLQGGLAERIMGIKDALISLRAALEVAIDFPEDEVEVIADLLPGRDIEPRIIAPLKGLISAAHRGNVVRQGVSLAICGRPNVGKSSLLNAVIGRERAIVSDIAGTTRDLIEESFDLKGIPVRITDTAGIRAHLDPVEEIGIRKAKELLGQVEVVILVVDGSLPPDRQDLDFIKENGLSSPLVAINKRDLISEETMDRFRDFFKSHDPIFISARKGEGLDLLADRLFTMITGGEGLWDPGEACVPNLRQLSALEKTLAAVLQVKEALAKEIPPDLVAVDLQGALEALGQISGETTTEEILDRVFADFCLGK